VVPEKERDAGGRKKGAESRGWKERKNERRRQFKINTCSVASFITGIHSSLHLQEMKVLLEGAPFQGLSIYVQSAKFQYTQLNLITKLFQL
jgi:hypothetical protein